MNAIEFTNVVKRYGKVEALRDVSFTVSRGEMFGLIGPDGAGKTTAIRAMCGLLHIDGGIIRVLGKDPVTQHRDVTASIGYLSQRFSLYGDLSIDENIAFFAQIHGVQRLSRAPQSAARDDAAHPFPRPARRSTLRRHEAETRAGVHARPSARRDPARRADDRRGSGLAARILEAAVAVSRLWDHDRHVDAVSR